MTWPELLIHAVVLGVGFPASLRNPTAAALSASWLVGQSVWWTTGDNLPLTAYFMADLAVITVIYLKRPAHDCLPYQSLRHQLACLWLERSYWDRVVVAIFPAAWALYALPVSDWTRWYSLWLLCIAQFLAAGGEALQSWQKAKSAGAGSDTPSSGPVVFRLALGRIGGGG